MDFFGISQAVLGAVETYFRAARRTGRTTSMLDGLKNGDRVIFATHQEAKHAEKLFKENNQDIQCVVAKPESPDLILIIGGISQGRTIFDHGWIEKFYINRINQCGKDIRYFEIQMSGYGEPHRITRRKAKELARWSL